jgi:hypothetical protein
MVSVVKMATVLADYTTEEQRCVVRLLWAKGLNAKVINKEMFSVYGGKCLSHGSQLDGKHFTDEGVETRGGSG